MTTNLKLAITNIGDLLLHDKIMQDKNGNTITDIDLVISDYQRPFKWTAENAIQRGLNIVKASAIRRRPGNKGL